MHFKTVDIQMFDRSQLLILASNQSLTRPVSSGYALALSMQHLESNRSSVSPRESRQGPRIRQNRMNISSNLPSQDQLKKIKDDKKVNRTRH